MTLANVTLDGYVFVQRILPDGRVDGGCNFSARAGHHPTVGWRLIDETGVSIAARSPRIRGAQLVADDDVSAEAMAGLIAAGFSVIARP